MKHGDILEFNLDEEPFFARVDRVLFTGTSRILPDSRPDPWRDLLVVSTQQGSFVVRERLRVRAGDKEVPVSRPQFAVFSKLYALADYLAEQSSNAALEFRRLYARAHAEVCKRAVFTKEV